MDTQLPDLTEEIAKKVRDILNSEHPLICIKEKTKYIDDFLNNPIFNGVEVFIHPYVEADTIMFVKKPEYQFEPIMPYQKFNKEYWDKSFEQLPKFTILKLT
jgi:hypothetical protein